MSNNQIRTRAHSYLERLDRTHERSRQRADSCGRILAMDAVRIVESPSAAQIFYEPKQPYDQALQKSIPALHEKGETIRFRVLRLISPSRFQAVHSRHAANLHRKNA